jgi:SAM-dependent methyltransferase
VQAETQLKRSEMGKRTTALDPIYLNYPCPETSGSLYTHLLRSSLTRLFDRSYKNLRVVDIGCGYGWVAEAFAKQGAEAYAVDISWSLCRFTNERSKKEGLEIMVVCCDGEHLPFRKSAFDLATFNASLHHLPQPLVGLSESLMVSKRVYIINEPGHVASINGIITRLSIGFSKYCAGAAQKYDSEMDSEENQQRFNVESLKKYCREKGCSVEAKGYWCYVPPILQRTNNPFIIWLWKATIEVLNTAAPNLGHTFLLKSSHNK